jgi:ATP-binding cassette subfamily F protein 3
MITVQGLTLHFGQRPMFDGVSFFIGSDDRIGLVGRNGAGKSTLLKILAGQQPYDKGTIGRPRELTMGYLPQEMAHNLELTPWQVAEGLRGSAHAAGLAGPHREGPGEGHHRRRGH